MAKNKKIYFSTTEIVPFANVSNLAPFSTAVLPAPALGLLNPLFPASRQTSFPYLLGENLGQYELIPL